MCVFQAKAPYRSGLFQYRGDSMKEKNIYDRNGFIKIPAI